MLEYLFCGNPCGGTSFTAGYLTQCGFPCGHECISFIDDQLYSKDPTVKGESNYIAIEWADKVGVSHLPIIMILRNPLAILNSFIALQIDHGRVIDIHSEIAKIVGRYNLIDQHPRKVFQFRVEYDLHQLCDFLRLEYRDPHTVMSRVHNRGRINLGWSDVNRYSSTLQDLASRLGY